jgi:hypothetical protein
MSEVQQVLLMWLKYGVNFKASLIIVF